MAKIGIIGGSGMDDPGLMLNIQEKVVSTKYGNPSSSLTTGEIAGVEVAILARHGKDHSIYPTGVNFRANIQALKDYGCTHIIATTAVGSLREELAPGHLVLPDQFIDFTKLRTLTFHDEGEVVHAPMGEPFCAKIRTVIAQKASELELDCHAQGTVITIEGPRFSTKAESHMFRAWGADIINMSSVPEVQLAREAGICYQAVAMSTDYDCWKEDEEPVTWEMVKATMAKNSGNVIKLLLASIPDVAKINCNCAK